MYERQFAYQNQTKNYYSQMYLIEYTDAVCELCLNVSILSMDLNLVMHLLAFRTFYVQFSS